jgi:MFS transporter, DHA3 family, macrolide efflux protein
MSPPVELLRDRSFRLLWSAQVLSSFGDALTSLALLLIAQRLTGSTAAVAATAIAIALPQLLVGLPAGVMVDRWNRRHVMIASDLLRALLVLGFVGVTTTDRLWLLFVLAFAQSAVGTFFTPARAALIAEVLPADRLLPANSLSDMSRVVAGVAGFGVAGALASTSSSLSVVFVADAATFVASAGLVALVRGGGRTAHAQDRGRVLAELAAGLRLVFGKPILLGVVIAGTVAMFGLGAANVVLVPFVVGDLGASEAWFGALEAAQVAAMVVAGTLVAAFASRARPTRLITAGMLGLGVSVGAIAASGTAWQLMILLFAAGWFVTPVQASVTTILQTAVPPHFRGRAQASLATLVSGGNLASMSLAGLFAGPAGIRPVFAAAGAITVVAGVASHIAFCGGKAVSRTALVEAS